MFRRVICVLLPMMVFAGSFDVPMGVSGNRLVLTVKNPDPFFMTDVRVSIIRFPDWFVPESSTAVTIDTIRAGSSCETSFFFYADNGEAGRHSELVLDVTDASGRSLGRRVIGLKTALKENRFTLFPAYPNPSNPNTTIRFALPEPGHVRLDLFNVLGRRVCSLINGEKQAGLYDVMWEGLDDRGVPVSTGEYVIRLLLETDTGTETRTVKLLLKK